MVELAPGVLIGGRYRLVEELGQGGMATVWRAEHVAMSAPVALKLIRPELARTEGARQRFLSEARTLASLRGPHVVQILDVGLDHEWPFISMELLHGATLGERLHRVHRLSAAQTARIITHVCRALTSAHERGIVHRDLTPHNVYLVRNDEAEIAKVLDFGIAKIIEPQGLAARPSTHSGMVLGTPHYMSPEQAQGEAVDHRSDLWSLGMIACECLTGRHPFDGYVLGKLMLAICAEPLPVPSSFGPVPEGFDAWFAKAVARDVQERFQTARQAAQALNRLCAPSGAQLAPGREDSFSSPAPESARFDDRPASSSSPVTLAASPKAPLGAQRTTDSTQPLTTSERPPPVQARRSARPARVVFALMGATLAVGVATRWSAGPRGEDAAAPAAQPTRSSASKARAVETPPRIAEVRAPEPKRAPTSVPAIEGGSARGFVTALLPALGVRIEVPAELTAKLAPNRLATEDESVVLTFTEQDPSGSFSELYAAARRESAQRDVSYHAKGDTWFVVSGRDGKHIFYEKTMQHADRTTSFQLRYLAGEKPRYSVLLEYMEDSFRVSDAPAEQQ
jgi:serine/threonine-protein kinase